MDKDIDNDRGFLAFCIVQVCILITMIAFVVMRQLS